MPDPHPNAASTSLDEGALAAYLSRHMAGFQGPLSARRFAGGQSNPTYAITTPGGTCVLRKKPDGAWLPSAHAVEREYRVIAALHGSAVPVPRTLCLCEDSAVIGTPFYVMEHVEGRVLWDPTLPGMDLAGRRAIYDEVNRVVAALHCVDVRAVALEDFGRPGNYLQRRELGLLSGVQPVPPGGHPAGYCQTGGRGHCIQCAGARSRQQGTPGRRGCADAYTPH